MKYPLEICLPYVFVIVFFSCSEVSGRVSGKVSVLDVCFLPWSARSSHFIVFTFRSSLPSFQEISAPKENNKHFLKIGNTMQYYGVSSGDMFVIRVCHCFFSVVLKFPEESLESFCAGWLLFILFIVKKTFCMFFNVFLSFILLFSSYVPEKSPEKFPEKSPQNSPEKSPEIFLPGISKFVCENLQVAERYPDGICLECPPVIFF